MPKKFDALPITPIKTAALQHLDIPAVIHLDDPAEYVLNDFKVKAPRALSPKNQMKDAEELMAMSRSHLLIVLDDHSKVIGIVQAQDIYGGKSYRVMHDMDIKREKITVDMIMSPLKDVLVIEMENLKHAKVGHIIETFRKYEKPYALAFDNNTIVGSFSLSQISKMMGESINSAIPSPDSIADLQKKLSE